MAVMAAADVDGAVAVRERLEAFGVEVLAEAMNRPVQVVNGGLYLRGLIEQGPRKSLEPMVERLGEDAGLSESCSSSSPTARGIRRWWCARSPGGWRR